MYDAFQYFTRAAELVAHDGNHHEHSPASPASPASPGQKQARQRTATALGSRLLQRLRALSPLPRGGHSRRARVAGRHMAAGA
jgi:hypothetical protein